MASPNKGIKTAVAKALEKTAAYHANNVEKPTVLDKVKDFVDIGRQQQVQALENTAAYYAKNAGKPTALDKVKDFVDTGRQQRVQALENTASHYADWIKENDRALWNKFISKEEDAPQPTTLGSISPTGDDELDAYLQDISAKANRAADNSRTAVNISNDDGRWLKAGAFSDGWQRGDITKAAAATYVDANKNLAAGALGIGEKAADSTAMLGAWSFGGLMPPEERSIYPIYSFSMDEREKEKQRAAEFVAKDLYDEDAISERLYTDFLERHPDINLENDSILGTKSRNLAKEAGELAAVYGLQAVGIPWWLTTGVNAFGNEAEHAVNEGASYDEATVSGLISAGGEILSDAISKGMKFAGKPANKFINKNIVDNISSKFVKTAIKFGMNALGEGTENVLVWAIGRFGQWLTYQDEKTLREFLRSKEAQNQMMEAFWSGFILEGMAKSGLDHARGEKTDSARTNKPEYTSVSQLSLPASSQAPLLSTHGKVPLLPAASIGASGMTHPANSATALRGNVYADYLKRMNNTGSSNKPKM